MIVTAWSNGRVGYGIKIKKKDRDRFFKRSWKSVILQFENSPNQAKVNVAKKSFWNLECRELIKKEIGDWLQNNGLGSWPNGYPPELWLEPLGSSRFMLRKLTPNDK